VFHVFPPVEKSESNILHKKWNNIILVIIILIGLALASTEPFEPDSGWMSFTDVIDIAYPVITEISADKPLAVFEFGGS
jgi:hypothetical protein